jgi:hypothetical protein
MEPLLHFGSGGRNLAEGQMRTTQQDVAGFFEGLNAARVVAHGCPSVPARASHTKRRKQFQLIREALLPLVRMTAALSDGIQGMTRKLRS